MTTLGARVGDLIRRTGPLVRRAGAELAAPGVPAESTARVSFADKVITWAELPNATIRASHRAGQVVAESVERDGHEWVEGGQLVEVAVGWRLHDDGVVLAEVSRPLRPVPGKAPEPAGPWRHRRATHLDAVGQVRRRHAVISVADEVSRTGGRTGPQVGPAKGGTAAPEAWAYLPSSVRSGAEALIPDPTVWFTQLIQESHLAGVPHRQVLRALLVSRSRALAVVAARSVPPVSGASLDYLREQLAGAPWLVEQTGFDLSTTTAARMTALPGRRPS
jgi:hypothetical protein